LLQVIAAVSSFDECKVPNRDILSSNGVGQLDQETLEYFRRRERAERAAAKNAASDAARRVHQELAQRYATLARVDGSLACSGEGFGDDAVEVVSRREAGFQPLFFYVSESLRDDRAFGEPSRDEVAAAQRQPRSLPRLN
jgi:hypothetical protein